MKVFPGLLMLVLFTSAASTVPAQAIDAQAPRPKEKTEVLWDTWYTVTAAAGSLPVGYYNDRAERKGGKIAFKNQFWKREENHINEEQIISIANDDEALSPEFWNFHSSYRASSLDIDGSFKGNILTAKVRQDTKAQQPITHSVAKKTFLSVMFPVWLAKKLPAMKPGRSTAFNALFEDGLANRFMPQAGSAKLEAPDDYAKETRSSKVSVDIDGKKSEWYVLPSGEPIRIEMLSQKLKVRKTTEAVARRFLIESAAEPAKKPE